MIAVDTNILIHAHRSELPGHPAAASAIAALAEKRAPWAIPWPCIHEFLAVTTRASVFDPPSPLEIALEQVRIWASSPSVLFLTEGKDHLELLWTISIKGAISGGRIHDARIAAICLSHGVHELWTADRDFGRFPQITTKNPLI